MTAKLGFWGTQPWPKGTYLELLAFDEQALLTETMLQRLLYPDPVLDECYQFEQELNGR